MRGGWGGWCADEKERGAPPQEGVAGRRQRTGESQNALDKGRTGVCVSVRAKKGRRRNVRAPGNKCRWEKWGREKGLGVCSGCERGGRAVAATKKNKKNHQANQFKSTRGRAAAARELI